MGSLVNKSPILGGNIMFNSIQEAIEDFKQGKMVIVVDDEDRENEGDLIVAAEKVTPQIINFMVTNARGLVCMPISGKDSMNCR
jgi:3,4-dihydroxy 2-butanone 4-phosphate synthase/GTP cyclohydrolase II